MRLFKRLLGPLSRSYVRQCAKNTLLSPSFQRQRRVKQVNRLAVLAPEFNLTILHATVFTQHFNHFFTIIRIDPYIQFQRSMSNDLISRVPNHLHVGLVRLEKQAVGHTSNENTCWAGAKHSRKVLLAFAQGFFGFPALCDITAKRHNTRHFPVDIFNGIETVVEKDIASLVFKINRSGGLDGFSKFRHTQLSQFRRQYLIEIFAKDLFGGFSKA